MFFRKNVLPQTAMDAGCMLLLFTFIPITFFFVMCIVLPDFHDVNGFLYSFYWLLGIFVLFNLLGNLICSMLIDSSIRTVLLKPPSRPHLRRLWKFCEYCETSVPPRSWHCQICRICILKRDHHCSFVGTCIGHKNHRYFLFGVVYLFLGSLFSTIYGGLYFWHLHADIYAQFDTLLKLVFPLWILFLDMSWECFYLFIYELNVVAFLYTLLLMFYHSPSVTKGSVVHETRYTSSKYDGGLFKNMKAILGDRMHLTWISPLISSNLPNDGVHWENVVYNVAKFR